MRGKESRDRGITISEKLSIRYDIEYYKKHSVRGSRIELGI